MTQITGVAPSVDPADIRSALLAKHEIALIDLRQEAPFAEAHPLFAACLPLGRLELEIFDRVPRLDTLIVVYDEHGDLIGTAIERLRSLGYTNVRSLAGGLEAWRRAGGELFRDVNVPSKAFGELVEADCHTPSLPAQELNTLLAQNADLVILDSRRFEEYRTMSIPSGRSVPGGELVLRVRDIAPNPETLVVVNCAGRTRSLIGAQSLINAKIPNRVVALRNGTIGWSLAGLALEKGQTRTFDADFPKDPTAARAAAAQVAAKAGLKRVAASDYDEFLREAGERARRTIYRFDVRTAQEYRAGHLPGFRHAPGGQLVQETDVFAPVRGAYLLLADFDGVRAPMTGSWLAQMGWDVYLLDLIGAERKFETGDWQPALPAIPKVESIDAAELVSLLEAGPLSIVDLAPSPTYKAGHIAGAGFALREDLERIVGELGHGTIILTSPDGVLAAFARADIQPPSGVSVLVLSGGTAAWQAQRYVLEADTARFLSNPNDVYRRPYEGTDNPVAAMQAYLDWEFGLVEQLGRDGTHGFWTIVSD